MTDLTARRSPSAVGRTQLSLARPLVLMNRLTDKLNPVVWPLMESIKRETDPQLQVGRAVGGGPGVNGARCGPWSGGPRGLATTSRFSTLLLV